MIDCDLQQLPLAPPFAVSHQVSVDAGITGDVHVSPSCHSRAYADLQEPEATVGFEDALLRNPPARVCPGYVAPGP